MGAQRHQGWDDVDGQNKGLWNTVINKTQQILHARTPRSQLAGFNVAPKGAYELSTFDHALSGHCGKTRSVEDNGGEL